MKSTNHRLEMERIDPNHTTKARAVLIARGAEIWSGCSCGHLSVEVGTKKQIEIIFASHVTAAMSKL